MSNNDDLVRRLRPCPFCGAADDELMLFSDPDEAPDNSGPSRRIQCAGCNVEAPFYASREEAIEAWNRRHPDAIEHDAAQGVTDEMVERATMKLLGKDRDPAPSVDWSVNRSWTVNRVRELMRSALEAALSAPAPDAGEEWKLVPVEPTDGMIEAGEEECSERARYGISVYAADIYTAMLAAAPQPPVVRRAEAAEASNKALREVAIEVLAAEEEWGCETKDDLRISAAHQKLRALLSETGGE